MTPSHKWTFKARFRTNAYSWRGSRLAIKRLKEAVSEIRKVARADPVLAADDAVGMMERLWPALQGIDGSSGALGNAVNQTVEALLPILITAAGVLSWPEGNVIFSGRPDVLHSPDVTEHTVTLPPLWQWSALMQGSLTR